MRNRSEVGNVSEGGEPEIPESKIHKPNSYSMSPFSAVVLCLYMGVLYVTVMYMDRQLPTGLRIKDEKSYPDKFIAERAQKHLRALTNIGPRVVGSHENEVLAVDVLVRKLKAIAVNTDANDVHEMEIDLQVVSGSYYLDILPFGGYNVYANIQNIVVKLKGSSGGGKGILVNAHFDSVPTSPGGSDDGINCAVMLELLQKLTQLPKRLKHDVVFLFNGAEETPLQASHGFITQHKWKNDVNLIINLEAAGSGGKEILFQSGPRHSWLLNYYKKVPRPTGQVAGEEIFQSNLIPSDTDFRIFRDFGDLVGYDIAFSRNGYRYHTNFDDFENIPLGTYQHIGDNMLHLLKSLGDAKELNNLPTTSKKSVYFDLFGFFMVSYNELAAIAINVFVIAFSLTIFVVNIKEYGLKANKNLVTFIIITAGIILAGWVLAILNTLIIGALLDLFGRTMTWYSRPWLLIGLYIVPTVVSSAVPMVLLNKYKPLNFGINIQSQLTSHTNRLIWTVVLLIGTCLGVRSSYAIMMPVLFNSIFFAIIVMINQQYSVMKWRILYVIINTFPVMLIMYQGILVLSLFIPITGRIGSDRNPELIVGLLTTLIVILISSFFIHYVTLLNNPKIVFAPLIISLIILGIIISPLGFPYSSDHRVPTPQRYMVYHTNRVVYDKYQNVTRADAGYFIINLDRNAPNTLESYIHDVNNKKLVVEDCQTLLVCGMPLSSVRLLAIMKEQLWIPANSPVTYVKPTLKLLKMKVASPTRKQFTFKITGPSHTNVFFSPKSQIKLLKINLSPYNPKNVAEWNNRSVYFINYNWGKEKKGLDIEIELQTPTNWIGPTLDIAVSGKEFSRNVFSVDFHEFINHFPSWTNVVPAVATFESWAF